MPLSDITVLDLSRILSGPFTSMALGDFGARVIKVEPPGGDDTRSWGPPFVAGDAAYFLAMNRNKESVVLDLKDPRGRAALEKLVQRSDVVLENFRPGTLARLGFGYGHLKELNPRVILCSVSGYGQTGPKSHLPGYDQIAQGMGGLMSVTGEPSGPPVRAGFSVADLAAAMWALYGIMLALRHRDRTGEGQWVDIALLDAMISFQTYQAQNQFASGKDPTRHGSAHPNLAPYQTFRARDGYVSVGVGNDHLWRRFCEALGLDIAGDARFRTNPDRVMHRQELLEILGPVFAGQSAALLIERLVAAGVPAGPVNTISQVFQDPQVLARDMVVTLDDPERGPLRQIGIPVKLSATPGSLRTLPPRLGEHTEAVLRELEP